MIDIHCHILPGVDDGAKSWDIAVEMCRMAHADGVTHIVATPHANHEYEYSRPSHEQLLAELQAKVPEVTFLMGCDFRLSFENLQEAKANPRKYAIGNSRHVLAEFSDFDLPDHMPRLLYEVQVADLVPVITHPERHAMLRKKPEFLEQFVEMGCLIQLTANSLTGFWGREVKAFSEHMLRDGLVDIIASDAHDPSRRTPILSEARNLAAKIVGDEQARRLVEDNPRQVIGN